MMPAISVQMLKDTANIRTAHAYHELLRLLVMSGFDLMRYITIGARHVAGSIPRGLILALERVLRQHPGNTMIPVEDYSASKTRAHLAIEVNARVLDDMHSQHVGFYHTSENRPLLKNLARTVWSILLEVVYKTRRQISVLVHILIFARPRR
jgi:hypothetical protein